MSEILPLWKAYDQIAGVVDIMNHWYGNLFSRIGKMPEDCVIFDLETSGFGMWDYVTQVGYAVVQGGEVVENRGVYVNVLKDPECNHGWLANRIETTRAACQRNGSEYHTTMELISQGADPVRVWETMWDLLDNSLAQGYLSAGYNGIRYDVPRVINAFDRYLGPHDFAWKPHEFFDVAAVVKGVQMGDRGLPFEDESLWSWAKRVLNANTPGVKWGLSSYAVEAYGLEETYDLDMTQAHTGDFDSLLVHYLMETFRRWADTL